MFLQLQKQEQIKHLTFRVQSQSQSDAWTKTSLQEITAIQFIAFIQLFKTEV